LKSNKNNKIVTNNSDNFNSKRNKKNNSTNLNSNRFSPFNNEKESVIFKVGGKLSITNLNFEEEEKSKKIKYNLY
jgi:hypothetical protein